VLSGDIFDLVLQLLDHRLGAT
jgi:hypothetical protein